MPNAYSVPELLEFLSHASEKGLMPAATAQSLAVACRKVFSILESPEETDLRKVDLDAVFRRFTNKLAKDFTPSSLKEYERRIHRAREHFVRWKESPEDFSVTTRNTSAGRTKKPEPGAAMVMPSSEPSIVTTPGYGYPKEGGSSFRTAFPIRKGVIVEILNVPSDLTETEAEKLSSFVRLMANGRE